MILSQQSKFQMNLKKTNLSKIEKHHCVQ